MIKKIWSKVAIDYSAGVNNVNGELIPNKMGCYVESYEEALDFAKRCKWKDSHIMR